MVFDSHTIMQITFIEQKGEYIIIYFGRPCDGFAERVWPIKISDGARVILFNKGLVSCDVSQSFLILLFEAFNLYSSHNFIDQQANFRRHAFFGTKIFKIYSNN